VQFQVPALTLTISARDLTFAKKAVGFITETRDNPKFRDKRIGKDRYRRMPEKLVDLSRSFIRTAVTLHKDGEFDDRYFVRIAPSKGCSGVFTIGGEKLDELVESLREIIVDQESPRQPNKALEPTSGTGAVLLTRPLRSPRDCSSICLSHAFPLAAHL